MRISSVLRAAGVLASLAAVCATLAAAPRSAQAHPLSTTAVLLNAEAGRVTGRVQLPIDRLAIALDQPLTTAAVNQPGKIEELREYLLSHMSATDQAGPWAVT